MNARMAQHFDRVVCAQMTARMRGKWSSVAVELIAAVRLDRLSIAYTVQQLVFAAKMALMERG
jgi:hypothetical protein